jgi:hypothetical protein
MPVEENRYSDPPHRLLRDDISIYFGLASIVMRTPKSCHGPLSRALEVVAQELPRRTW